MNNCNYCKKEVPYGKRKYCSYECLNKGYYLEKRNEKVKYQKEYYEKNKEKNKEKVKKRFNKWRKNNRERFNILMMKSYQKNKLKWNSRNEVRKMIKYKLKPLNIKRICKQCEGKSKLLLHIEEYDVAHDKIRRLVDEGKIYYLCRKCRKIYKV